MLLKLKAPHLVSVSEIVFHYSEISVIMSYHGFKPCAELTFKSSNYLNLSRFQLQDVFYFLHPSVQTWKGRHGLICMQGSAQYRGRRCCVLVHILKCGNCYKFLGFFGGFFCRLVCGGLFFLGFLLEFALSSCLRCRKHLCGKYWAWVKCKEQIQFYKTKS